MPKNFAPISRERTVRMVLEQRQEFTEPPPNPGRFTGIGNGTHVGSLAWSTITDYRIDDNSFELLPA